ncbi:chalcone isomerase family protein [Diaphorobacter caeni]|uniref:chalcone isomerase family protein n=1 Tax=Diaphorobacter caeni TaxID=2784387 RepID=UPI001E4C8054|nr:chalcone isomerase family protein [Diaphorobacter caeni]
MISSTRRALVLAPLACALASVSTGLAHAASAMEVGGVTFAASQQVQQSTLQLNGAGVRYKAVFKVYAAGLYLEKPASTPAEVFSMSGPKRLMVSMLREIDSSELGKLFSRGMEDNMDKAAFSKLVPGVLRMSQIFSEHKKLQAGDVFMVDWVPGTGTIITVRGQQQGEPFKEPEFFNALLGIWLGPQPADWKLKDGLLGKKA